MNKEQLLARLAYYLNPENGIGAALYFVVEQNEVDVIRFADIEDDAKGELKDRFLKYIEEKFITNDDLHYMNISEADERKNVVYKYDLEDRPESLNILDEIIADGDRDNFNFNEHRLDSIKGYLITIGNEANQIALYKKHHPINLFKQDRFLLIPSDNRLIKVGNDALAIDKSFDFMMVDNHLIVLNINTIERFFGFEDVIRNQAQATIAIIEENEILEDIVPLKELAGNITNAKKLMSMRNSPVLDVSVEEIIDFITNHPELTGRIKFNEDGTKVKLTTVVSKKLFLKLLNDDYLFSQLTELQYDSHAKDRINQNGQEEN